MQIQPLPRCQVVPLADDQLAFLVDGAERLRWHSSPRYPRPFFWPLTGPSGNSLTRMGHPGAPNHDHHRSVWFAHQKVLGIDFWSDQSAARIRQLQWLAYEDGDNQCAMAVRLGWFDGHDASPLVEQELITAVRPRGVAEMVVELQATFRPASEMFEFGQTNFGFLAVRVAKSISAHFGQGHMADSHGRRGEAEIFGNPARWVDYSGPVRGPEINKPVVIEGLTFIDHATNPGHPTRWHVRDDGWMGASVSMSGPVAVTRDSPLVVRYLLLAHREPVDAKSANRLADEFDHLAPLAVVPAERPHEQFLIQRKSH